MKTLVNFLLFFGFFSSVAMAAQVPSLEDFDKARVQARKLSLEGSNVVLCYNKFDQLLFVGVEDWNSPMNGYFVSNSGALVPLLNAEGKKTSAPVLLGKDLLVVLRLGQGTGVAGEGFQQIQKFENAVLGVHGEYEPRLLSCFRQVSGLE